MLLPDAARSLFDAIDVTTIKGLRDRALIATMIYTFARASAARALTLGDYQRRGRRAWLALHEKRGQTIDLPFQPFQENYLDAYIAAGRHDDQRSFLFRSLAGRSPAAALSDRPLIANNVWTRFNARALAAGITGLIICNTLRATGITAYLQNGGQLHIAQQMAGHASPSS